MEKPKAKTKQEKEVARRTAIIDEAIVKIRDVSENFVCIAQVVGPKKEKGGETIFAAGGTNPYTGVGLAEMMLEKVKAKVREGQVKASMSPLINSLLGLGKSLGKIKKQEEVKNHGGAKEGKIPG